RLQGALGLFNFGFEQAFLDAIERGPLLDQIAFLKKDRLQVTFHPRPDVDPVDSFDPPDEVERLRNRTLFSSNRADRNGSGSLRVRRRSICCADQQGGPDRNSHFWPPSAQAYTPNASGEHRGTSVAEI